MAPRVRRVLIIAPTPTLPASAPRCIAEGALDWCSVPRAAFDTEAAEARRRLAALASRYRNVQVIDPAGYFCTDAACAPVRNGVALYWDDNHVSSTAVRAFAEGWLLERN